MYENPVSYLLLIIIMVSSGIAMIRKYGEPTKKEYYSSVKVGSCISRKY